MRRFLVLVALAVGLVSVPDAALGAPRTMAEVDRLHGQTVDPSFPVDYVGVLWDGEHGAASIRFRDEAGRWGSWRALVEDGVEVDGEYASGLVRADDADAYQVRVPGSARRARAVAINTTDGPRERAPRAAFAATTVISRAGWQADESLMTWAPQYYEPAQKITVHHTATTNNDPDPAATVRAIYRYHSVDRKFGDIGYHFLVDEAGRVYEGRYSGTDGDPAHDGAGSRRVVTAAHVGGYNSANLGVAFLGTFTSTAPTAASQSVVKDLIAELAARHGIDPNGSGTYVNPVNGVTWTGPNVPGHRDWEATECPGGALYALLPSLRGGSTTTPPPPAADTTAPVITGVSASPGSTTATIRWTTNEPSSTEVRWRVKGASQWSAATGAGGVTAHSVNLTSLTSRTRYEYVVRSVDAAGNGAESAVLGFQTKR